VAPVKQFPIQVLNSFAKFSFREVHNIPLWRNVLTKRQKFFLSK